jgi:hypothetical protein
MAILAVFGVISPDTYLLFTAGITTCVAGALHPLKIGIGGVFLPTSLELRARNVKFATRKFQRLLLTSRRLGDAANAAICSPM